MVGGAERSGPPPAETWGRFRSGPEPGVPPLLLGVVGTFVLDRIAGLTGRDEAVEDLGGIAYALSGVVAALPHGWRARPVARLGMDASERVRRWLGRLAEEASGRVELDGGGLVDVPEPNNRVELRYRDDARRTEHLTGGVGGWRWDELDPLVEGCDALLVNFISGHELELDGLRRLRVAFGGPIYADLHSLFLDTADDGTRVPRRLPRWREWLACFDAVQMNADELDLLRGSADVEAAVTEILELGPRMVARTRGADGVTCWWSPGRDGSVRRREIPAVQVADPDPTGCGDVWGAVMCCRLLAGEPVPVAAGVATRLAGAAAGRSGVDGLSACLAKALDERESGAANPDTGEEP